MNELDSELPSKFGQDCRKISDQKSNELSQPNHNPNKNSTDGNKLTQCSMSKFLKPRYIDDKGDNTEDIKANDKIVLNVIEKKKLNYRKKVKNSPTR